ncbi:hypothetical protein B9Z55_007945 [Caenorhabditis nigoni]|uniref:Uncharacterized protein n=1 Tax=Caenorhabditis nigoni TaxID=1611254 RepID=A0A2G5VBX1_9PELO|nr:hypothetical protein B9Z55_007945 [Caenorhabditis nigoni]
MHLVTWSLHGSNDYFAFRTTPKNIGSFREKRYQNRTGGPIIGPPVPKIATTVQLFRQRSHCSDDGPNVPTTIPRV